MKLNIKNLRQLRYDFEEACLKSRMSESTKIRYQSWIKRYISHCKRNSKEVNINSCIYFLNTYEKFSTKKQGFYALKFLFTKVLKIENFPNKNIIITKVNIYKRVLKKIKTLCYKEFKTKCR